MTDTPLPLSMTQTDFHDLLEGAGSHPVWAEHLEPHGSSGSPAGQDWKYFYRLGSHRAAMVLARMYLTALGAGWDLRWDDEDETWILLSDHGDTGQAHVWEANENNAALRDLGLIPAAGRRTTAVALVPDDNRALALMRHRTLVGIIMTGAPGTHDEEFAVYARVRDTDTTAHPVAIPERWPVPDGVRVWTAVADYLTAPPA